MISSSTDGVVDDDLEQEAVELRFGERVGSLRSIGFWVASTRNGRARGTVSPPVVTRCSCIASSNADCILGGARSISSASSMLANTGPSSVRSAVARLLDPGADKVRGHQVGSELDAG